MEGITILNTTEIRCLTTPVILAIAIVWIIFVVGAGILTWYITDSTAAILMSILITSTFMLVLMCIIMDQFEGATEVDRIQHEVMIDSDVSMQEFYQKYEIIEQRGKIFVVEEKKP